MTSVTQDTFTTIRDLLRYAVTRFNRADLFYGHGTHEAYDEAVYLILHTLKLPINQLEPYLDAKLLSTEIQDVLDIIERRADERIPAPYLTHEAWQGEFSFYVDERVLIPRSFIFELLGEPLKPWIEFPELIHNALDVCTGSGCLAIQLAHHYPDANIDAVDISLEALEVAAINIEQYGLEEQIQLIHTDLLEGLDDTTYDLIISNPPYVDEDSMMSLPSEYEHEPELALASGVDGLDCTRRLIEGSSSLLNERGVLLVEIGHNRDILEQAYPNLPFVWMDTASGDAFVFLLTKEDLVQAGY